MLNIKIIITTLGLLAFGQSTFALQALDDASMSQSTGQDGITITLKDLSPNARIIWTDTNGINSADGINPADIGILSGAPQAGAVVFGDGTVAGNFRVSTGTTVINIDTDAGNGSPFTNISISLPDDLVINTGSIYVAGKDANNDLINQTQIMKDMTIRMGGLNLNLQLGGAPQGDMVKIYGVINSGIQIENIAIMNNMANDTGIGISKMTLKDTGSGSDLNFKGLSVGFLPSGMKVTPSAGKVIDVLMQDFKVGNLSSSDSSLGAMALVGLQIGGNTLTISGH